MSSGVGTPEDPRWEVVASWSLDGNQTVDRLLEAIDAADAAAGIRRVQS